MGPSAPTLFEFYYFAQVPQSKPVASTFSDTNGPCPISNGDSVQLTTYSAEIHLLSLEDGVVQNVVKHICRRGDGDRVAGPGLRLHP